MHSENSQFKCCCGQQDCHNVQEFNESFKRVEYDALLAAEIGQALLNDKNEEQTFESFKDNLHELKQLRWEYEQSKETISSLENEINSLKQSTIEMKKKMDNDRQELERKKLCEKLLSVKTDIEQELKTQVSDLKQELSQLRKSNHNLQLKSKRLGSNYEALQLNHEALLKEHDTLVLSHKQQQQYKIPMVTPPSPPLSNTITYSNKIAIPEMIPNNPATTSVPQFQMTFHSNKNPFDVLQSVTQQTFDKINATDTRILNRRLRRVFDISELSDMSNNILRSILIDLKDFKTQFDWVHQQEEHFFPLVNCIQQLLQEISTMKMTLNDLQADYVKRIERLTVTYSSSTILHSKEQQLTHISKLIHQQQQQQPKASHDDSTNSRKNKGFMQGFLSFFTIH